jgi:hypothetical protein
VEWITKEYPLQLFPQPPVDCIYTGCTRPTLIMISKPVKILCVSYEVSQKLSEKPRSGGAYTIGPGLSGKTKALRVGRSEGLNSEAGAPVRKDPGLARDQK